MRWIALLLLLLLLPAEALVMVTVDEAGKISTNPGASESEEFDVLSSTINSTGKHQDSFMFTTGTSAEHQAAGGTKIAWFCVRMVVSVSIIGVILVCGIRRDWCERAGQYVKDVANQVRLEGDLSTGGRTYLLDNAKFLLQVTVVYHHICRLPYHLGCDGLAEVAGQVTLTHWFDCFNMPLYTLISGYVAKGELNQVRTVRLVERILLPFLFFIWLYWFMFQLPHTEDAYAKSIVNVGFLPGPWSINVGHLWYLVAYMQWRCIGAVFRCLFSPYGMLTSAYIISWFAGYWEDPWVRPNPSYEPVTGQVLAMLPFYITGQVLSSSSLKLLSIPKVRFFFGFVAVTSFLLTVLISVPGGDMVWRAEVIEKIKKPYRWHTSYDLDTHPVDYLFVWSQRLTLQVLVVWPTILGFLAIVPQQKTFFTELGQHSMYCYILHLFILRLALLSPTVRSVSEIVQDQGVVLWELFLLAISLALALLLMSPITRWWASYLIEPAWVSLLWKEQLPPDSAKSPAVQTL